MIIEMDKTNEKTWNDFLAKAGIGGTFFQTTYWAEYLRKTYGDRPIYLASLDKKGDIQGLLLAIESCYGKHPALTLPSKRGLIFGKLYKHAISPPFHKMLSFIFWEDGPIILSHPSGEKPLHKEIVYRNIIEKIVEKAQKRNSYEIKFARPALFSDQNEIFSSLGFWKRRMGTILVNLEDPLDAIWSRIKRTARKNIEKLQDDVEIVKVSKRKELEEFYDMHKQTSVRARTKTFPYSYFTSLWDHFSRTGMVAVFVAKLEGKPIGGSLSLIFNNTICEYAIVESDYARSMRLYSGDVLKWGIMKWGHEKGLKYFDLAGVELYKVDAGDKKAEGIYRYKSKWGGQLIEFNVYGKVFPRKRKIIKLLNTFLADSILPS